MSVVWRSLVRGEEESHPHKGNKPLPKEEETKARLKLGDVLRELSARPQVKGEEGKISEVQDFQEEEEDGYVQRIEETTPETAGFELRACRLERDEVDIRKLEKELEIRKKAIEKARIELLIRQQALDRKKHALTQLRNLTPCGPKQQSPM